jgi:hypothetical protein
MPAYPTAAFAISRAAFEAVVSDLSTDSSAQLDHAGLERVLAVRGLEVVRCLMQDYLDVRAERERSTAEPMRGADRLERNEFRPSSREVGSLFGTVLVHRLALVKHGVAGGLRPLDAHLNLPDGKYSHGVQREVAWSVAQVSFDGAVENVRRLTGTTVAKRQAEEMVVSYAADFEDFYVAQPRVPDPVDRLLVLTFDGSGVVMREEGLRPETRKKAEKSRRKTVAETAADVRAPEEPNRKRMAEVAAVYSLEVMSRTPEDVMRELRRTGPRVRRPKAQNKRVWASLERPITAVVDDAFYEAVQRDEAFERRWVALVDGNRDQLDAVRRAAARFGVEVTIVVDFIHVLGYLWKAGKALNVGVRADVVDAWVTERAERVLRGEASLVAAGIRRSATRRGITGVPRKAVDKCANYLLNHKACLRYDKYLRDGLPIATGVIEGACRSLVQDRMDITGARWGLQGAEAVLKLRSLRASADFDDYVKFHERRELERNHLQYYDQQELLELREAA